MRLRQTIRSFGNGKQAYLSSFTLVELLAAVAIIGVLATLALPRYRAHIAKARMAEAKVNLAAISSHQKAYRFDGMDDADTPYRDKATGYHRGLHYGLDKCGDSLAEAKNELGFRLSDCSKSRYRYITNLGNDCAKSDGAKAQGQVYPNCIANDEWHVSLGGKLTHADNVIKKCPDATSGSPSSSCSPVAVSPLPSPPLVLAPSPPTPPSSPSSPSPSTPPSPPTTPSPPSSPSPPTPPSLPTTPSPPPTNPSPPCKATCDDACSEWKLTNNWTAWQPSSSKIKASSFKYARSHPTSQISRRYVTRSCDSANLCSGVKCKEKALCGCSIGVVDGTQWKLSVAERKLCASFTCSLLSQVINDGKPYLLIRNGCQCGTSCANNHATNPRSSAAAYRCFQDSDPRRPYPLCDAPAPYGEYCQR